MIVYLCGSGGGGRRRGRGGGMRRWNQVAREGKVVRAGVEGVIYVMGEVRCFRRWKSKSVDARRIRNRWIRERTEMRENKVEH